MIAHPNPSPAFITKSEGALLDMRRSAEEDGSRVKGLLVSLQSLEQRSRSSLEQDRARLREEGLRVEAAQISASAAADAARQEAAKARAALAEERLEFAKEKVCCQSSHSTLVPHLKHPYPQVCARISGCRTKSCT